MVMGDYVSDIWVWILLVLHLLFYIAVGLTLLYLFWRFVWKKSRKLVKGLIVCCVATVFLTGSGWVAYQNIQGREHFVFESGTLQWNEYTYTEYGNINHDSMLGKPFGHVDRGIRVFLCEGQPPEEWLFVQHGRLMGYIVLYKENSVTEIPDGFEAWPEIELEDLP